MTKEKTIMSCAIWALLPQQGAKFLRAAMQLCGAVVRTGRAPETVSMHGGGKSGVRSAGQRDNFTRGTAFFGGSTRASPVKE